MATPGATRHHGGERLRRRPPARQPVDNNRICSLFRDSYGYPVPVDGYDESFIPATLDSFQYMAYYETGDAGDEWYHTLIFGGTVHHDADRPLLEAQMVADRKVIAEHYATFGFPIDD